MGNIPSKTQISLLCKGCNQSPTNQKSPLRSGKLNLIKLFFLDVWLVINQDALYEETSKLRIDLFLNWPYYAKNLKYKIWVYFQMYREEKSVKTCMEEIY